ncbi:MAG: hypothetical protein RKL32_14825, partial [Gammaproteobacteria bacterium]
MRLSPLLFPLLFCLPPAPVAALDLAAAATAIDGGRAEEVVPALAEAANAGEPGAAALLASLYQRGDGVARNHERAAALYLVAARAGDAEAQLNLGNMYQIGRA